MKPAARTGAPSGALLFVALVFALLAGCGGGGGGGASDQIPPTAPPGPETVRDYWMTFGSYFRGVLVRQDNGEVWTTWEARDGSPQWGDTIERTDIMRCGADEYVVLRAFEDQKVKAIYPLSDERTELSRDGGAWVDVSKLCGEAAIYMPAAVPASGDLKLRQWGWIHAAPGSSDRRPFYWESHFSYGLHEYNPCWRKGAESRQVVVQEELWWDGNGGWARGRGSDLPWRDGKPAEVDVAMIHRITIAKGAGVGWTINEPSADLSTITKLCLAESEYR